MNISSTVKHYPSRGVVPLLLHRIVRSYTQEWEDVPEDKFRRIVEYIGSSAFSFCENRSRAGGQWLLTFDDGCSSDYDVVFPILLEFGVSATFFIITDRIGKPGYVTWPQVREMHLNGMCIGSHGRSHRRLTDISFDEAIDEFNDSKLVLEDKLGSAVELFSFPQGATTTWLCEQGLKAGYSHMFTSAHGVIGVDDRVNPRNCIHSAMDWSAIHRVMEPGPGTRLRWRSEDIVKRTVKGIIGYDRYVRLRNHVLR